MQVFATYSDPIKCAKFLDNKRLNKMILESAQLLSSALHLNGVTGPYKMTHIRHPLTSWVSKSRDNFKWLLRHIEALSNEYTHRFKKVHKTSLLIGVFRDNLNCIPQGKLFFINCTDFKYIDNVHLAYRICLRHKWKNDKIKPRWRKI